MTLKTPAEQRAFDGLPRHPLEERMKQWPPELLELARHAYAMGYVEGTTGALTRVREGGEADLINETRAILAHLKLLGPPC